VIGALACAATGPMGPTFGQDATKDGLVPTVDCHHLMEYIVEEAFDDLKEDLAAEPANKKAWRGVLSSSAMLAETGNLLLIRRPKDVDAREWTTLAVALRETGSEVMKTAKAREYAATKKAYAAMVAACNNCHTRITNGEPKVEP
jgi:hypothetical protein